MSLNILAVKIFLEKAFQKNVPSSFCQAYSSH
jgi:hypothetical protein